MDRDAERPLSRDGRHMRRILAPGYVVEHDILQQAIDGNVHDLLHGLFIGRQVASGEITPVLRRAAIGGGDVQTEAWFGGLLLEDKEPPGMSSALRILSTPDLLLG